MIIVTYTRNNMQTRIEIPEGRNPFDVCEAVRTRLFPNDKVPLIDQRFDAAVKRMKAKRKAKEKS